MEQGGESIKGALLPGDRDGLLDRKIRWRSRRALVELDMILDRALQSADFAALRQGEKVLMLKLLETADYDLWETIIGKRALDPVYDDLLTFLRRSTVEQQ
jgi:succinate dehydrogenase flavin-adding protein (antitoxin of CptAB toxin-antitoxin module)